MGNLDEYEEYALNQLNRVQGKLNEFSLPAGDSDALIEFTILRGNRDYYKFYLEQNERAMYFDGRRWMIREGGIVWEI